MAVDRAIPTTPPSNTTMAYFAGQVQEELTPVWQNVVLPLTGAGGPNAITASAIPALTAYTDTLNFILTAPAANTGAVTLNVDGLGATPVRNSSGVALSGGELASGQRLLLTYSAGAFYAINLPRYSIPAPTAQYQFLQANASLSPNWSLELYAGNF